MTRLHLLLVFCALSIAWIAWDSQVPVNEQSHVQAQRSDEKRVTTITPEYALSILPRQRFGMRADLFDVSAQQKPQAAKSKTKKTALKSQPKQEIEPLPFVYLGKWQEGGDVTVLIEYQNQVMPIHQGDILIDRYKVLTIEEVAQTIVVTFESTVDKTQQQLRGKG